MNKGVLFRWVFLALIIVILLSGCLTEEGIGQSELPSEIDDERFSSAINQNDPKMCKEIQSKKIMWRCLDRLATINQDVLLCSEIEGLIERDECTTEIAVLKEEPSFCSLYIQQGDEPEDHCLRKVAGKKRDSSICESIHDTSITDQCYYDVARDSSHEALCEKISSKEIKDSCYLRISLPGGEVAFCEKIKTSLSARESCYQNAGTLQKDASLCDKITDIYKGDECYASVSIATSNAELCERILESGLRDNCYLNIAIETQDEKHCEKILDPDTQDYCYRKAIPGTR
jgi:hypothetical protein